MRNIAGELKNKETVKNKNKLRFGVDNKKSLAIHLAINSMKYGEKSVFRIRKEYLKTLGEYQIN